MPTIKFAEVSELILLEYKAGEFNVSLTEQELGEYRIVERMFNEWQIKLKERAVDKYGNPGYSNDDKVWRD